MAGIGIEILSLAVAKISGRPLLEVYLEINRNSHALIESGGACERLFNKKMRECDWQEFAEELGRS